MTKAAQTVVRMIETLPEHVQEMILEKLSALVEEARDEATWNDLFARKADGLGAAARRARREIEAGKAIPMDYEKL